MNGSWWCVNGHDQYFLTKTKILKIHSNGIVCGAVNKLPPNQIKKNERTNYKTTDRNQKSIEFKAGIVRFA